MQPVLHSLAAGLPVFLLHLATALAVWLVALWVYLRLTPHDEMTLIREGNSAAAVSLGGAALGLAIPLALCLHSSVNVWDIVLWGAVTLIVQIVAFRLVDFALKGLPARIERGEMAAALFLATTKTAVALLNAAAVAG